VIGAWRRRTRELIGLKIKIWHRSKIEPRENRFGLANTLRRRMSSLRNGSSIRTRRYPRTR
jgi:hypothetical protein